MRVAFLPGSFRPDRCGVSHYTARLVAELARCGVECLIATSYEAAATHRQAGVVGAAAGWGAEMLVTLPVVLRRLDPDVLHIQHAAGSFGFRRAVFALPPLLRVLGWRRPIVVTAHEYGWWEWRPRLWSWAWRHLAPWGETRELWDREDITLLTVADAVIVTHEAAAQALAARLPGVVARAERVPIGSNIPVIADASTARAALRRRFGWEPAAPVVSYFGFVHPVKGLETLLHAFHQLLASHPQARLLVNGGVESLALSGAEARRYQEKLVALTRELGLESVVRWTGYLPDDVLSQHLAGSDVGVLPFHGGVTAKSGSLLAMWSHGLPVVATRPPVPEPELERAAVMVACRDPGALACAMRRLLDDADLRRGLADTARQGAAAFSWPAIARRHLDIYRRLTIGRRSATVGATPPVASGSEAGDRPVLESGHCRNCSQPERSRRWSEKAWATNA